MPPTPTKKTTPAAAKDTPHTEGTHDAGDTQDLSYGNRSPWLFLEDSELTRTPTYAIVLLDNVTHVKKDTAHLCEMVEKSMAMITETSALMTRVTKEICAISARMQLIEQKLGLESGGEAKAAGGEKLSASVGNLGGQDSAEHTKTVKTAIPDTPDTVGEEGSEERGGQE